MKNISGAVHGDVFCFSTAYSFDVSVTEIFSFLYGAAIFVLDISDYANYRELCKLFYDNRITHMAISPSGLKKIFNAFDTESVEKLVKNLKCVMVAGEAFKKEIFDLWDRRGWQFCLINMYGPTEATVYATYHIFSHGEDLSKGIPIGISLDGSDYYLDNCDSDGRGEIVLSGDGIARGYINNETENARRFIENRGVSCYKTGDIGKTINGELYFYGRNDDQIQVNGIRVELGEIESRISSLKNVVDAAVIYRDNSLTAFVCSEDDCETIKSEVAGNLPRFMVPNRIIIIDSIPLNDNGKVDRKKLSGLIADPHFSGKNLEHNKWNKTEGSEITPDSIADVMKDVLELDLFDTKEDFFEKGADSLDVFEFLIRIERRYGIRLNDNDIYNCRTPEEICEFIKKGSGDSNYSINTDEGIYPGIGRLAKDVNRLFFSVMMIPKKEGIPLSTFRIVITKNSLKVPYLLNISFLILFRLKKLGKLF